MFDGAAFGREMVGIVKGYVNRALAPLIKRLDDLDSRPGGITEEAARLMVEAAVGKAIADLPTPAAQPVPWRLTDDEIRSLLQPMVDALPKAENGKSVSVEELAPMIAEEAQKAVAALPAVEPIQPSDEHLRSLIEPLIETLPKPQDGKSVSVDDVAPIIAEQVSKAVAALPVPKDGVGLAGALIDRQGQLVVTLTDGSTKELGVVVGKDIDQGAVDRSIKDLVAAIPKARDGVDGVGFDDMTAEYDGERSIVLRFVRGEQVKEFAFTMPVVIDRGVWVEGRADGYAKGDGVTWAGSFWISQKDDNGEKPDGGDGWRLSVKRGRDGKPGKDLSVKELRPVSIS